MTRTDGFDEALLFETDLLVVGGGLAGVAAATAAAGAGLKTALIERRTYLGAELTATLRPWLSDAGTEAPLIPDDFKRMLEDRLLAAGVRLLYAVRPIAIQPGIPFRVEVAGKWGRRWIAADQVIDATEQAVIARQTSHAEPRYKPGTKLRLWRSMEMMGVDLAVLAPLAGAESPSAGQTLPVPLEIAAAVRLHPGHAIDEGHLLVEHAVDVTLEGEMTTWQNGVEIAARFVSMRLARWLREHHPAFAAARVTETAHELVVPPLWRVAAGAVTGVAASASGGGQTQAPSGLWVAGGCQSTLDDVAAASLSDEMGALMRLGEAVGRQAAAAAGPARRNGPHGRAPSQGPQPEPTEPEPVALPTEYRTVDVLVIGGGTSGASAALGAARQSARTLLAEMLPGLGGTGTLGGVDSYWFGRKGGFNQEISRRVAEEHAWMGHSGGKWNTESKMLALLKAQEEAGVEVLLSTVLVSVRRTPTGQVTGAVLATPEGLVEVTAKVTVDATGDGDAAVLAGGLYIYGSDREGIPMWYSMAPHLKPGMTKNNFTTAVDVGDPFDYTRAILSARRRLPGHDHGPYVAPRESRHILAETRLTLTDILTMRQWPDVINIHFSNHDIKGQNTSDWLRMGLLPPNLEIEIPWRLLLPVGVDGLIVSGKAFSVTHDALPPVRMQADLENLGFVCGVAAAMAASQGVTPRELDVRALQAALVPHDILPESVLQRTVAAPATAGECGAATPSNAEMRRWIAALDDETKLYLYGEMRMDEVRREPIPMVMVCTAGPAIIPLLQEELALEGSPRRLQVARALAWYGDQAATPVLLTAIGRELRGAGDLPYRGHISYTQASPDHGAMPELAYLLHSLAMVRDRRAIPVLMQVAERLNPTRERLEDQKSGLFHYVDAICDVAERLGHPDGIWVLRRLHGYDLFRNRQSQAMVQPDIFAERLAFLEVTIGRALARCGDVEGVRILVSYLDDSRRLLVRYAHRELMALSGLTDRPDSALWRRWVEEREM